MRETPRLLLASTPRPPCSDSQAVFPEIQPKPTRLQLQAAVTHPALWSQGRKGGLPLLFGSLTGS